MWAVRIQVDAGTGFGWRVDDVCRSHEFGPHARAAAGEWELEELDLWQPWKELLAVERCLLQDGEQVRGCTVLIRPDASTTVRYVNKGRGSSVKLTEIMRRICFCVRGMR